MKQKTKVNFHFHISPNSLPLKSSCQHSAISLKQKPNPLKSAPLYDSSRRNADLSPRPPLPGGEGEQTRTPRGVRKRLIVKTENVLNIV